MTAARLAEALRHARAELGAALDPPHLPLVSPILDALARAEHAVGGRPPAELDPRAGSERELLEQRVREQERALRAHDEFLSTLGHELRNPLSPIFMQAQYLLEVARAAPGGTLSADWLASRLELFCRALAKFLQTLNRLMDVSRVSAGRLQLELADVVLSDVVEEVCAGFERELSLAQSELRKSIQPGVVGCWDRLRLEQICMNLISNAVRYGAGKPIEVALRADAHTATLSVKDHGVGIAEEDQHRIFQRFERAQERREAGGFGIGLWIVRESCQAMGGRIEVQSRIGQGSTFIVSLPRARTDQAQQAPPSAGAEPQAQAP